MEILQKAKELGVLLSESEEMKTLKESEALVNQDEKAVSLIDEHRQIQLELIQALREGKSKEEIEAAKAKFAQKQKEINDYNVTRYFFDSKKNFDDLIKSVNNIITHEVTGNTSSCGGSCSTCGGCH